MSTTHSSNMALDSEQDNPSPAKRFLTYALFALQIVGIAFVVYDSPDWSTWDLNPNQLFGEGLEICGALVLFALYLSLLTDYAGKYIADNASFTFMIVVTLMFFVLIFDAASLAAEGRVNLSGYLAGCNYVIYLIEPFLYAAAWWFVAQVSNTPARSRRAFALAIAVVVIISVCMTLANLVYPWRFYVGEDGHYTRGECYLVGLAPSVIQMLIIAHTAFSSKTSVKLKLSVILYIGLPLAAILTSPFLEDIPVSCIAGLISVIVLHGNIYQHRGEIIAAQQRALSERETELSRRRMSMMVSQIQPHFLYNSLTAIMGIPGNPPETRAAIASFGKYLRSNLDTLTSCELISFASELDHIRNYASLELLRFPDKLNVVYRIRCRDFLIPPLCVQVLVENAIKHGITPKDEGGTVTIISEEKPDHYLVKVIDDGVGFSQSLPPQSDGRTHVGLSGARVRLANLQNATLDVDSEVGIGTVATIRIPKR